MTAEITFGTDGWRAVIADAFTFDSVKRVAAILLTERHRREVSPAPAYRELRATTGFGVRFGVLCS